MKPPNWEMVYLDCNAETVQMKVCRLCYREKPLTKEFFFGRTKSKDGFRNECKECMMNLRRKNSFEIYGPHVKECHQCHVLLPASEDFFYKKKSGRFGVSGTCISCRKVGDKEYRRKNLDKIKERQKAYNVRNREKICEKRRKYYYNHVEQCLEQNREYQNRNPDKMRSYWRAYYYRNRRERHMNAAKYRLRKMGLQTGFTYEQWLICLDHFNHRCAYCRSHTDLTQDHLIPVSSGGEYTVNNIVPACKSCNSSKNNKPFADWYQCQAFYSASRMKKIYKYLGYIDLAKQQLSML